VNLRARAEYNGTYNKFSRYIATRLPAEGRQIIYRMKHVWRDLSPRYSVRYEEQEEALNQAMDVTYAMNVREQSKLMNSGYDPPSKIIYVQAVKQFLNSRTHRFPNFVS
jgi:hypothetical protein